jgi:hypothetical protein
MTTTTGHQPHGGGRRGAALLVVIGLVSLLMIAAVAFSILMTIERSASSNFRHSVQARHLLYAGLAQAIVDIDADVGDSIYPIWSNTTVTITTPYGSRSVQRKPNLLQSYDPTQAQPCSSPVLSADALQYLPRSLYQSLLETPPSGTSLAPEAKAISINGTYVGRYAYVIANVSGLLDANVAGRSNRWFGTCPEEIQLDTNVLTDVINTNWFAADRTADYRYETLPELARLNTGIDSNKLSHFETFSYALENQMALDGKPKLYIGGDIAARMASAAEYYPGTGQSFSNRLREILQRSDVLGYTSFHQTPTEISERVDSFISCMLDYTDADSTPRKLNGPNVEGDYHIACVSWVPTINWYPSPPNASPGRFIVRHDVTVYAYNFAGANANTYVADVLVVSSNLPQMTLPVPANLVQIPLNNALAPVNLQVSAWTRSGGTMWGTASTSLSVNAVAGYSGNFVWTMGKKYCGTVSVRLSTGGNVVDQVPLNWGDTTNAIPFNTQFPIATWNNQPCTGVNRVYTPGAWWSEAIDPRCNWSGDGHYGLWIRSDDQTGYGLPGFTPSMSPLTFATYILTHPSEFYSNGGGQFAGHMYDGMGRRASDLSYWNDAFTEQSRTMCPNRPFLSVGELAYIPIDNWQTPRLFDHGDDTSTLGMLPNLPSFTIPGSTNTYHFSRLYSYFTMTPPPATAGQGTVVRRGLININTDDTNVLAAAFQGMPLRDWDPNNTTGYGLGTLNYSRAAAVAQLMRNYIKANLPNGVATNADALTMIPWNSSALISSLGMTNEMDRKAIIRNSMALFTARQQIYTIIVKADAMTFDYGGGSAANATSAGGNILNSGSVLGSAHAVFQVWRDPIPDANGIHPCFVRLCKILSL